MHDVDTEFTRFEARGDEFRRLLRQEELILEVTEGILRRLKKDSLVRSDLAKRLGRTRSFVSQILNGRRNLTLRTLADIGDALNCKVHLIFEREIRGTEESPIGSRCQLYSLDDYRRRREWTNVQFKPTCLVQGLSKDAQVAP